MAVYLKVVSAASKTATRQTLQGQECLVFFLGGVPNAAPHHHPGGVNFMMADGSVRFVKSADEIVTALRTEGAGKTIILGPADQTGYCNTRWELAPGSAPAPTLGLTSGGGQAVMIGMLLPAVQAAREAARKHTPSPLLTQLKSAAGSSGHVFVVGEDGLLLPA